MPVCTCHICTQARREAANADCRALVVFGAYDAPQNTAFLAPSGPVDASETVLGWNDAENCYE